MMFSCGSIPCLLCRCVGLNVEVCHQCFGVAFWWCLFWSSGWNMSSFYYLVAGWSFMMMMDCFCRMIDQWKVFTSYFQLRPLTEILTIANLWHTVSRVWTCAESEFRFCWMKLCSSDNWKRQLAAIVKRLGLAI